MDAQLRSLTTDLINLQEESRFDPADAILTKLKEKVRCQKRVPPKWRRKLDLFLEPVSQFFGFNVIGVWGFLLVLTVLLWGSVLRGQPRSLKHWNAKFKSIRDDPCAISITDTAMELGRPTFNCNACLGLKEVPTVTNITKEEFLRKHAYTGLPLLVKGGVKNWKAVGAFSYEFFKKTYGKFKDGYEVQEKEAQFFPYKTEFESLKEALSMSEKRRNKSWYFGWSNAHPEVGHIFRQHYSRPHFLPDDSESSQVDWLFMGKQGAGAQVHIDAVARPSWQAQVRGKKTWSLFPPAECDSVCQPINGTMETGDMIVVDTNQWFHSTYIWPGEISITIGSEYD